MEMDMEMDMDEPADEDPAMRDPAMRDPAMRDMGEGMRDKKDAAMRDDDKDEEEDDKKAKKESLDLEVIAAHECACTRTRNREVIAQAPR